MYISLKRKNFMNEKHVVTKNANKIEKDITPCAESLGGSARGQERGR